MATLEQATADAGKPRDHLTARNNSQLSANYTNKFCSLLDKERALAYDPNSRSQICWRCSQESRWGRWKTKYSLISMLKTKSRRLRTSNRNAENKKRAVKSRSTLARKLTKVPPFCLCLCLCLCLTWVRSWHRAPHWREMSRRKRDHNSTLSHWTTKSKWSKWMKHQVHLDAKQKFDVLTEPGRTCWVFWGAFSEAWTSRRHWWTAPPPPQPYFDWLLRSSVSGLGFLFGSLLLLFEPQSLPG